MKTKKGFKVQQCSAFKIVTEKFNHSVIPIRLIKFPIRNLFFFTVICFALFMAPMVWAEGVIQLPKTGQTKCYNTAGTEINCTGTGQDGEIQAGVAWPSPRFTDNGNATITDNLTGLIWAKEAGTPTIGTCTGGVKKWQNALDYIACLNNNNYLGYGDWRLPSANELESLANVDKSNTSTWLNSQGFTNVQSRDYGYWSSTTSVATALPDYTWSAWNIFLWKGSVEDMEKGNTYHVWPVRGVSGSLGNSLISLPKTGQTKCYSSSYIEIACTGTGQDGELQKGVSWPNPRFADNANQTVIDKLTGLIWSKDANAPGPTQCSPGTAKAWQDALDHIKCLNTNQYLGFSDWRLPNRKELYSLVDFSRYNPSMQAGHPFTNVQLPNVQLQEYWSSTTLANPPYTVFAWSVGVSRGYLTTKPKNDNAYIWPVRTPSYSIREYTLNLKKGWNLFSTPLTLPDPTPEGFVKDFKDKVRIIWGWDSGTWKVYKPDQNKTFITPLTSIEPGKGYWIYMNEDKAVNINGTEP